METKPMTNKQRILNEIIQMLNDLEVEVFKDSGVGYFNGVEYKKSDWRNYIKVLESIKKKLTCGVKASASYLKENPEYNRIQRKLSYYNTKKNKKPVDYFQIELLQKQRKDFIIKKQAEEKKRKEKEMNRLIDKAATDYDISIRGIE